MRMPPRLTVRPHGASLARLLAAIAAALLLVACDQASGGSSAEPVAGTEVAVVDNDFEPAALEVPVGETVTWTWKGDARHDVVGDDFESDLQQSGTFTHSFDEAGEYDYRCTIHGGMRGTVVVDE